jgi:hypothetical protein
MYILLGCKIYSSSWQVISLNISWPRIEEVVEDGGILEDNERATECNWLTRYEERPPGIHDELTILQLFHRYTWKTDTNEFVQRRNAIRVINIYPIYLPDPRNPEMYSNYYRVKLQLYHPYRNLEDLQMDEDGRDIGWIAIYKIYRQEYDHDLDPLLKP